MLNKTIDITFTTDFTTDTQTQRVFVEELTNTTIILRDSADNTFNVNYNDIGKIEVVSDDDHHEFVNEFTNALYTKRVNQMYNTLVRDVSTIVAGRVITIDVNDILRKCIDRAEETRAS